MPNLYNVCVLTVKSTYFLSVLLMMLAHLAEKLPDICRIDLRTAGCTTANHEEICARSIAGIFGAEIVTSVRGGPQYCFYNKTKNLDLVKTGQSIRALNLRDGYYVFPCPYNRLSYVPPPDIFLFRIVAGAIEDYIGFECKCSMNTLRPTWNDSPPRLFRDSRILYIFSSITHNRTYVFAGDLLWDYSVVVGDIVNLRSEIEDGMSRINGRIRGPSNPGGVELSYRMRYVQKADMPGDVERMCRSTVDTLMCNVGVKVAVSAGMTSLVDYDETDGGLDDREAV
jgi:hypothetical protein